MALNKRTTLAGLSLNVNPVKSDMKTYFEEQGLLVNSTDKKSGNVEKKVPMFSSSDVAVTACIQQLCKILVTTCSQYIHENMSGVSEMNRPTLKMSILLNRDLKEAFFWDIDNMDEKQQYSKQLPISTKELRELIKQIDPSVMITAKAYNFLTYLLLKAYFKVINTAYEFISYSGKKTVDSASIVASVKNKFGAPIANELCSFINSATNSKSNQEEEEEEEKDNVEVKEDNVQEDKEPSEEEPEEEDEDDLELEYDDEEDEEVVVQNSSK